MSRESLGIILNGCPDMRQKQSPVLKAVDVIFRFVWILFLIIAIGLILYAFVENSGAMLTAGFWIIGSVVFWGFLACVWSRFRCRFCGHFFTLRRISANKLVYQHNRAVTRNEDTYHSGVGLDKYGNMTYYIGKSTHKVSGTESEKEFTYNARCSCCQAVIKLKQYSFESH